MLHLSSKQLVLNHTGWRKKKTTKQTNPQQLGVLLFCLFLFTVNNEKKLTVIEVVKHLCVNISLCQSLHFLEPVWEMQVYTFIYTFIHAFAYTFIYLYIYLYKYDWDVNWSWM